MEKPEYLRASADFSGTIYGYDDSNAQAYANVYEYKFSSLGKKEEPSWSYPENSDMFNSDGVWDWYEFGDHAEICGYSGESETMEIPDTLNGLPVTKAYSYFSIYNGENHNNEIKKVKIPAGFTDIYSMLNAINGVSDIEVDKDNKSFAVEDGVLYSADKTQLLKCLKGKVKGEFSIPNTVTNVANAAFSNCSEVTVINVPASVESIEYSLNDCTSLEAINVSKLNVNYSSIDGVLFDKGKNMLYLYPQQHAGTSYTVPETVTWIGDNAFENCDKLESVKLHDKLTLIMTGAFRNCGKLDNVVIPDSINRIEAETFENCSSLKNIEFTDNIIEIGSDALYGTQWLNDQPDGLIYCGSALYMLKDEKTGFTEITVKEGTRSISSHAFCKYTIDNDNIKRLKENTSLKKIVLPESVEQIGSRAFGGCTALTTVNIPSNAEKSGFNTFSGCTSLKDIILADTDTEIGSGEYENCGSLENVVIPERITTIDSYAFCDCSSLDSITIKNPECEINGGSETINNSLIYPEDSDEVIVAFNGTICGYDGSTAEKYAKDCGYKFKSLGKAPNKLGDVNDDGSINAVDASSVLSYYAMISTKKDGGFTDEQKKAADVNHDGAINAVDASCILSYYAYTSTTKETVVPLEEYLEKEA
ncbi:leucine-rich repeat protein [Ruminococcus sp.]|uniref:leucine-rich repeat protein n=1 Tax=Ruminococcus sp. TaxID=41978 RepID=UPI0025F6A34D|nr:leucine-rich repeat protein [Ruminococcus sp.]MCR4639485.1 leucine-rich repeat protein [Ruminococcus sp.]